MKIENLGQLINHLAIKAGVSADDANLKNILANAELSKLGVHSDLVKSLDENLIPQSAADDVFGPKIRAQVLNTFDKKMEEVMEQLAFDDTAKAELKGVKSSYERFEKLGEKIKELTAKKEGADSAKDKTAYQKQIDELIAKLQTEKKTFEEQLTKVQGERLADKIGFEKRSLYNTYKTIYDGLDADVKGASIDAVLNKALQDKQAEFAYDDNGAFVIRKKDGTALLGAGHAKYTPQSFIDETLAQHKILAVNNQQQQNHHQQGQPPVNANNGQPVNGTNQSVASMNLEAMKAFQDS